MATRQIAAGQGSQFRKTCSPHIGQSSTQLIARNSHLKLSTNTLIATLIQSEIGGSRSAGNAFNQGIWPATATAAALASNTASHGSKSRSTAAVRRPPASSCAALANVIARSRRGGGWVKRTAEPAMPSAPPLRSSGRYIIAASTQGFQVASFLSTQAFTTSSSFLPSTSTAFIIGICVSLLIL